METSTTQRPGFFIFAVALHVLEGLAFLLASGVGVVVGLIGLAVAAGEVHGDDETALLVVAAIGGAALLGFFFLFGLATLLVSYKAWTLSRPWIWALILLSLFSVLLEPWGIVLAAVTVIGGVQALERLAKRT